VEHPVLFIENLLKLGIGEKGRLVYLRNALTKGTIIHDSDKKFLKKMQQELDKSSGTKSEKSNDDASNDMSKNSFPSKTESKVSNKNKDHTDEKNKNLTGINSGNLKIQNLLSELRQRDSKLMDNLELLLISHEGLSQSEIENPNSFDLISKLFKSKNIEWLDSVKKNLRFKKF